MASADGLCCCAVFDFHVESMLERFGKGDGVTKTDNL